MSHLIKGLQLVQLRRYDEAVDALEAQLATNPADTNALRLLCLAECGREDPTAGLRYVQRAVSIAPDDGRNHSMRGIALSELKHFDEAYAAFDRSLELRPTSARTRADYVNAILRDPKMEGRLPNRQLRAKALTLAKQAVELEPEQIDSHLAMAKAHAIDRSWKKAEEAARRALTIDASNATALTVLAAVQEQQGKLREAGDSYVAAGRADPTRASADNLSGLGKLAPVGLGLGYIILKLMSVGGKGARAGGASSGAIIAVIVVIGIIGLLYMALREDKPAPVRTRDYSHLSPEARRIAEANDSMNRR